MTVRHCLFLFVALSFAPSITRAADSIFQDQALEEAVRRYVFEKRNNDEPLDENDVQNISTISFKGFTFDRHGKRVQRHERIKNLAGLEKCVSLRLLDLEGHEITDISPIKELKLLQSVNLSQNKVADITPVAELTKLQYLHLADNEIADLSALEKLDNMRSLYLSNNKGKDVKPLAGLNKLWSLYLDGNQVTDLQPLSGLKWLKSLDLSGNGVTDIAPLAELREWEFLFLSDNKLTDIQVLVDMAKEDRAGSRRFAPFWNVYLSGNPLSDEARKVQLQELREASVPSRIHYERPE